MRLAPRQWARYQNENNDIWDTRHYDDDQIEFEDGAGRKWKRVALTQERYETASAAKKALDSMNIKA